MPSVEGFCQCLGLRQPIGGWCGRQIQSPGYVSRIGGKLGGAAHAYRPQRHRRTWLVTCLMVTDMEACMVMVDYRIARSTAGGGELPSAVGYGGEGGGKGSTHRLRFRATWSQCYPLRPKLVRATISCLRWFHDEDHIITPEAPHRSSM
jgi:hypothetical protein